ncbi:ATP-binding protein [Pelagibacterium mangrovi]|uniref:ATP-binding protein n=1 Tax=Pelagibacterium mangrovi TaxID=3119828 RepID=UPI002FCBB6B6
MTSIRGRLVIILMVATSVVWLSAVGWIYFSTRAEVERVLDARLSEAGRMVSSLVSSREIMVADAAGVVDDMLPAPSHIPYDRQLSCQLWSFDGTMVGRSDGAPQEALATHDDGFAETQIDGERWRVFAISDAETGIRVLVGDSIALRERLVGDVITGLIVPAGLTLPLMAGLILVAVNRGLVPLDRVAGDLARRRADELDSIEDEGPREVRPMLGALNALFARVRQARERERNFTAFAAHELRTPLTGLKTQAQIAIRSEDPTVRQKALEQIVSGVDRTSRMVSQLLAIAAVEAAADATAPVVKDAGQSLRTLLSTMSLPETVAIAGLDQLDGVGLLIAATDFDLIFRNLVENAIAHSPQDGTITFSLTRSAENVAISVLDEGAGMADDDIAHAKDHFFRGRNQTALGSGLGLSIADAAVSRANGSLDIENARPNGLRVLVTLPLSCA